MNFKARIEKLRERFLRCESRAQLQSAIAEGGSIVIQAIETGIPLRICDSLLPILESTKLRHGSAEALQANFFQCYAITASQDPTFFMVQHTELLDVLRERYAAFCLELAECVSEPNKDPRKQKALELWNAGNTWAKVCIELDDSGDWRALSQEVKRYAESTSQSLRKGKPGTRSKRIY